MRKIKEVQYIETTYKKNIIVLTRTEKENTITWEIDGINCIYKKIENVWLGEEEMISYAKEKEAEYQLLIKTPINIYSIPEKHYQLCPKCNGQGIVNKPPWIAGDQYGWSDSSTSSYVCDVCNGSKIILVS